MVQIELIDANDFIENVTLDGTIYKIHLAWNDFSNKWSIDIRNTDNVDLVRNIVVVPNFPLLAQYKAHNIPQGELLAVVNNTAIQNIGRKDFINGTASLVYIPEGELNDILETTV